MVTMPAVTAVQNWRAARSVSMTPLSDGVPAASAAATSSEPVAEHTLAALPAESTAGSAFGAWRIDGAIPGVLLAWLAGVALLTLRLAGGWLWVQRATSRAASPAAEPWQAMAADLARRLRICRPIRLLESAVVEVPTVIGWLKPVVLIPASALAGMAPHQIEAVLAHELAHVRRHDYLVNLLQAVVETLLFYHPAVWWISRRIRQEREHCCDDLAVSLCGDRVAYAAALADLEERRGGAGQLALAATDGSLLHRVRRLLGAPTHAGRAPGWLAGAIAVLLLSAIAAGAVRQEAPTPPASGESQSTLAAVSPSIDAATESLTSAQDSVRSGNGRRRGNWAWSNDGLRLEASYDGDVEFTDDDSDVKSLSPGGYLKLNDGGWFGGRGVEFRADPTGKVTRRYRVGIVEKPYEPEGRAWLAQYLPHFIRQSGIGAPARVARILKTGGPQGVFAEITRIEGSYGKRIYFTELFRTAQLDAATTRAAFAQASREMTSDYELASMLIASQQLVADDATRKAYFEAASKIRSDYELRRVLSAGLKSGPVTPDVLTGILTSATSIESDYELASLLVQIARLQAIDSANRRPFFTALESVSSAYERGRVLNTLSERSDLSPELVTAMLQSGARLNSDYERAQFLLRIAKARPIDATLRDPFFAAVAEMQSGYEIGRVLQTVAKRPDTPADTIVSVLKAAGRMTGHYERAQVLLAVAGAHSLSGPARDAYITAADGLGDYEQGRVLTALVRNERGRK
jgi:beta-lactamase regulating signal transducer with metallopeptidase domain